MTNAEKLNVNVREFLQSFSYWYYKQERQIKNVDTLVAEFLQEEIKPTLTEDERVILRNIKNDNYGKYIGRGDSSKVNTPALWTLYLRGDDESKAYSIGTMYDHLFQFIQERRRI